MVESEPQLVFMISVFRIVHTVLKQPGETPILARYGRRLCWRLVHSRSSSKFRNQITPRKEWILQHGLISPQPMTYQKVGRISPSGRISHSNGSKGLECILECRFLLKASVCSANDERDRGRK